MELKDTFVGRVNGVDFFRTQKTEAYVEVPPALLITDEQGDSWTIGSDYAQHGQRFEWGVMRNDRHTGEMAERIVFRNGKVRIFGWYGWKTWNGRTFV